MKGNGVETRLEGPGYSQEEYSQKEMTSVQIEICDPISTAVRFRIPLPWIVYKKRIFFKLTLNRSSDQISARAGPITC
jgi:hypothetical protein